jgi:hypothetical protein
VLVVPISAADNQLSGGLDDFNMEAEGFIASLYFNVSKNNLNQSTIPAGWYSNTLVSCMRDRLRPYTCCKSMASSAHMTKHQRLGWCGTHQPRPAASYCTVH